MMSPTVDARPTTARIRAASPKPWPGMSANRETISVLMSAEKAAAALIWCSTFSPWLDNFSGDTEMATKSNPMSAPETAAQAAKNSLKSSGTTARNYSGVGGQRLGLGPLEAFGGRGTGA